MRYRLMPLPTGVCFLVGNMIYINTKLDKREIVEIINRLEKISSSLRDYKKRKAQ